MPPVQPAASPVNPTSRSRQKLILLVILLLAIVASVVYVVAKPNHKANNPTSSSTKTHTATATVNIEASGFTPATIVTSKGGAVNWTNQDSAQHQVIIDSYVGSDSFSNFQNSDSLNKGGLFGLVFDKVGTYSYHDNLHPELKGTIIVK